MGKGLLTPAGQVRIQRHIMIGLAQLRPALSRVFR